MLEFLYKKFKNIDMRKVFKTIFILVIVYAIFAVFENIVSADILDAMGEPENFRDLLGSGKYLQSPYRSNYYLDVKSLGITDLFNRFTNWLANHLWSVVSVATYMLLIVFNLGFSMDIADMFKEILNTIMISLKTAIFDEYFILLVSIAVIYVAISFFRNNIGQMLSRLGYIILTIVLMTAATLYSSNIVTGLTTLSKSIGASSIVAVSNRGATEDNIGQISGELWANLVHRPWLELEFDGKHNKIENIDGVVDRILSMTSETEERQKYIDELNKGNSEIFKETVGSGRILPASVILVVNIVKMVIMIVLAIFQIVFQIVTILFVLTFPFMLLLSISPKFGGVGLLSNLANQILGAQVGIVLTSFLLGLMIKMDALVAIYLGGLGTYGWFAITVIQTVIYVGVVWQRKQIFRMFMSIQSKISASSAGTWSNIMKTTDKGVDGVKGAGRYAVDKVKDKAQDFKAAINSGANNFGDKVRDFHSKHFNKETVGDRVRRHNEEREKEHNKENVKENIKHDRKEKNNTNSGPKNNTNTKNTSSNKVNENEQNKAENIQRPNINYAAMKVRKDKIKTDENISNNQKNNRSDKVNNIEKDEAKTIKNNNAKKEKVASEKVVNSMGKPNLNKEKNIPNKDRLNKDIKLENEKEKNKKIEAKEIKNIKNIRRENEEIKIKDIPKNPEKKNIGIEKNIDRKIEINKEKISSIDRAKMFKRNIKK